MVRYGSHSTPLIITTSAFIPFGGNNLIWVGKVAPPNPTTPAAFILATISSGENGISFFRSSLKSTPSTHWSSSTFLMITAVRLYPELSNTSSIF